MKTLTESIKSRTMGGFFKNVGTDLTPCKEWIDKVPVYFDLYNMQYDTKVTKRDRDHFTITFISKYKRNTRERDITLDLSPYILELSKYDPEKCVITFGWGWGGNVSVGKHYDVDYVNINHPDSKFMFDFDGYGPEGKSLKDDKIIRVTIAHTERPNIHPEKNIITGTYLNGMGKGESLIKFGVYHNDFPFEGSCWTVLQNRL